MKLLRKLYRKYYDHPRNWYAFKWEEMKPWYINGEVFKGD